MVLKADEATGFFLNLGQPHLILIFFSIILTVFYMRVSMGLTDRRKTAKKLVDSRKNWKILTVSRK